MYAKENANVKTKADLQNLIASVILHQTDDFTLDDVVQATNQKLVGSPYYATEDLQSRCADTLHTLFVFNGIQSIGKDRYAPSTPLPAVSAR